MLVQSSTFSIFKESLLITSSLSVLTNIALVSSCLIAFKILSLLPVTLNLTVTSNPLLELVLVGEAVVSAENLILADELDVVVVDEVLSFFVHGSIAQVSTLSIGK